MLDSLMYFAIVRVGVNFVSIFILLKMVINFLRLTSSLHNRDGRKIVETIDFTKFDHVIRNCWT